jgi:Domain of unknown function (DUF4388)
MALQGTLDTFELPDVLRLLASTRKTGCLVLRSERGEGSVWLEEGRVVSVDAPGTPGADAPEGLFDLLRAHEGAFVFEAGGQAPATGTPSDVEPLLAGAEAQLVEWREIEAVVPSLEAWVSLNAELPREEITVDADTWRLVATVGSGLSVGELGRLVGLPEVPVSRVVRDLVELGLGAVSVGPAVPAPWAGVAADAPAEVEPASPPSPFTSSEPVFAVDPDDDALADLAPAPLAPAAGLADEAEADEIARQLAMLSPAAAEAVRAAAAAQTDEERDAALEAVDDDDRINRGLLLKFLSTVK